MLSSAVSLRAVLRRVFALLAMVCLSGSALAEPWLSTRFAQHCAGCHAPGRKNVVPADRRCTLSCQGCHVNPNGGGLRSYYGKWNEDRVLRMFRSDALRHEASFAPLSKQHYGGRGGASDKGKKRKDKEGNDEADDGSSKKDRKAKKPGKNGFPLVEVANPLVPEHLFKRDGREFEVVDRAEYLRQIPEGDPYRLPDESKVDAGGDVRWQSASYTYDDGDDATPKQDKPKWSTFLMAADFGIRHRPFNRKLNLVYEFRLQGNPSNDNPPENELLTAQTRSMYAMVDDLPYNVFVMGGFYRPLFGNFVPDHYQLAQEMTALAMTDNPKNYSGQLFNAVSIGTAPNVPYLNLHLIDGRVGVKNDRTRGYAANAGLRFVTLGASINYSYWRTKDAHPDKVVQNEMHSIGAAAKLWRTVTSLEAVSIAKDVDTTDFRQGGVYTLDTYTQLWRELYFTLMYAKANVNTDLKPGSANQAKVGLRAFLLPGVDVLFYYETRTQTAKDEAAGREKETKLTGLASQLHVYF
jgi:hypothetical protein